MFRVNTVLTSYSILFRKAPQLCLLASDKIFKWPCKANKIHIRYVNHFRAEMYR